MRLSDDKTKYSSQWTYVEVARYVPDPVNKVIRESSGKNVKLIDWSQVEDYASKHNNTGIYTSIFRYNKPNIESRTQFGSLFFDLDSSELETSRADTILLYEYLREFLPESAIRVYFTGYKGFHVECEALALGVNPGHDLAGTFRYIAQKIRDELSISTLDFQVYDSRRMWRLPYSRHQKTGLYKNELGSYLYEDIPRIKEYCAEKRIVQVPEQEFCFGANEWYREKIYEYEESKIERIVTMPEVLKRFNQHGTKIMKGKNVSMGSFDPKSLFDGCPSVIRLWEKAEKNHHLEHEERLFLCSILTYSDDAIEYLHAILSQCSDYSYERSTAHIQDWIRRREMGIGGRPYSCKKANAVGAGCGNCELEPKKKWVQVGDTWVESDEYSEPSPIRYAYDRKAKAND